jgi:NADH-quinone oxidoreductase subunit E
MLSQEEQREIEAEMRHYPRKEAVAIDALKIVQKHRGWVSDEALCDVSGFIGVGVSDLDSVATFYNLIFRKPVGRHVVYMCDSVSCWIMGGSSVIDRFHACAGAGPGQTNADGRFTLIPIVCLGACDRAPVVMIDDDLHMNVDPADVEQILNAYQ